MFKKLISLCFFFCLLNSFVIYADEKTEYINKVIENISENWSEDYYESIEISKNLEIYKKNGQPIDFKQLISFLGYNDITNKNELLKEIYNNKFFTVKEESSSYKVENPYQTCRIYVVGKEDLTLDKKYPNAIPYDNKHWIILCNNQEETFEIYNELIGDTNLITVCLDKVASAITMGTDSIDFVPKEYTINHYYSYGFEKMNIDKLKENAKEQVTVGIIDSGIERNHPFFQNRIILDGLDILTNSNVEHDEYGHGTHVTSTIVEGTTDLVSILPIKVFDEKGTTTFLTVDTALKYAISQNVDCINMSLGFYQDWIGELNFMDDTIYEAYKSNIIFVKSAGNHHTNVDLDYPYGNYIITVGAIDETNNLVYFSNYGPSLDFVAYGCDIYGAYNSYTIGKKSGTSMAAPHITACVALLKSERKNRSFQDIYIILKNNSKEIYSNLIRGIGVPIF